MKHLIAEIKIKPENIILPMVISVTVLRCYFSATLPECLACLLLLVLEFMFLIRRPRVLFERRLNDFFVVIHYPLMKWHKIYQSVTYCCCKQFRKENCDEIFHSLTQQMENMFAPTYFPNGYYRTITHETVAARITLLERDGYLTILNCKPIYSKSLIQTQKAFLRRNCKRCENAGHCHFQRFASKQKRFYYVEFQVHFQQPYGRP